MRVVSDYKGNTARLVSINVFGCECFCACNGTNALKFTVKE